MRTARIIEADILFNTRMPWSVADSGRGGRFDVESIALHEIGHLFGLGHSALGETELLPSGRRRLMAAETVMFPLAFGVGSVLGRTLMPMTLPECRIYIRPVIFGSVPGASKDAWSRTVWA